MQHLNYYHQSYDIKDLACDVKHFKKHRKNFTHAFFLYYKLIIYP
jgi:hypothetical protein